jgi:hypothetical protein
VKSLESRFLLRLALFAKVLAVLVAMSSLTGCIALIPSAWSDTGYRRDLSHSKAVASIMGRCFRLASDAYLYRFSNSDKKYYREGYGFLTARNQGPPDVTIPKGSSLIVEKLFRWQDVETTLGEEIYVRVGDYALEANQFFIREDSHVTYVRDLLNPCEN